MLNYSSLLRLTLAFAMLTVIILANHLLPQDFSLTDIGSHIRSYGIAASLIFILVYAVATILLLPLACMAFIGGYAFGFSHGLIVNILGAACGIFSAFILGRYVAADWVKKRLSSKSLHLIQKVENMGWRFIALVRLTPFIPFDILNFAFGVTNISLSRYMLASMIFTLPGIVTYTYLGKLGLDILLGQPQYLLVKLAIAFCVLLLVFLLLPRMLGRLNKNLSNA